MVELAKTISGKARLLHRHVCQMEDWEEGPGKPQARGLGKATAGERLAQQVGKMRNSYPEVIVIQFLSWYDSRVPFKVGAKADPPSSSPTMFCPPPPPPPPRKS